jgi:multidrug efflux pump subunit AcrA (membrane-fusion protein)
MSRLSGSLRLAVPLLAIAFGTAALAVIAASTPSAEAPTVTAQPDNPAPPARVAGAGVVEPASRLVALAPRRAGVIAAVTVAPGDRVARGDLLLQLDDSEALAQLRGREAEVRAAEAALQVAEVVASEAGERTRTLPGDRWAQRDQRPGTEPPRLRRCPRAGRARHGRRRAGCRHGGT